jgi:S-adenosylmethionine synthetase
MGAEMPPIAQVREALIDLVVLPALQAFSVRPDERTVISVNPQGVLATGGPAKHSGLTGRKGGDDTYGEFARHSGSALSGKDPSRIERIGAYAARHAAKNVVVAGLADECEVMLSYSIGQARPVSVRVETFGTGTIDDMEIQGRIKDAFDFRPAGIVARLNLRTLPLLHEDGFYIKLASYGHMGRPDLDLPWEMTDVAPTLR